MLKHTMKFLRDLFTGPDGETWAIGRIYTIPILAIGCGAPVLAILHGQTVPMGELGLGLGGVAGACAAMVAITNHVDNAVETKA